VFSNPSYRYINPGKDAPSNRDKVTLNKRAKQFTDISLSFEPHPLTGDITILRNERAINNSIKNLIMIAAGEVPFQSLVGSHVRSYMFEMVADRATAQFLKDEIKRLIEAWEPRANLVPKGTITPMGTAEIRAQQSMDNYNNKVYFQENASFADFMNDDLEDAGVYVSVLPDQNEYMVTVTYKIVGYNETFQVDHILTPTR
jgi:phage baseplate assembly protein W